MSGKSYLLDTNVIFRLLSGNLDFTKISDGNSRLLVSFVSELEYKVFEGVNEKSISRFDKMKTHMDIVYFENDEELINTTVKLRKKYNLKLPDAIIAASALCNNATLLTGDKDFDRKIYGLKLKLI